MAAKKAKAVKKAPAKKAAAPKAAMPTKGAITEKYGKTQIVTSLAESTGLNRKQVAAVIDGMSDLIGRHLDKKGAGEFVLPGLFKIATIRKPATKARKGINPFTKEEVVFKAKPARTVIKVRPLKKLKEMV